MGRRKHDSRSHVRKYRPRHLRVQHLRARCCIRGFANGSYEVRQDGQSTEGIEKAEPSLACYKKEGAHRAIGPSLIIQQLQVLNKRTYSNYLDTVVICSLPVLMPDPRPHSVPHPYIYAHQGGRAEYFLPTAAGVSSLCWVLLFGCTICVFLSLTH